MPTYRVDCTDQTTGQELAILVDAANETMARATVARARLAVGTASAWTSSPPPPSEPADVPTRTYALAPELVQAIDRAVSALDPGHTRRALRETARASSQFWATFLFFVLTGALCYGGLFLGLVERASPIDGLIHTAQFVLVLAAAHLLVRLSIRFS